MRLETYQDRFPFVRVRREAGVLELTLHRDGGSAKWDFGPTGIHAQLGELFYAVGQDLENRVVILTGAGEVFLTELDYGDAPGEAAPPSAMFWDRIYREGKALLANLLEIEVPVIGAVNGDAFVHAELPLLSDIVLCAEHARFADKAHVPGGAVPGDGVHVVWPLLLGPNRGRYFLMTGQEIDAQEALRLGVVGEVLPRDQLMARAWELARQIAAKPPLMTRYARIALTQDLKRRLAADLSHGLLLEGLSFLA
jgi:enoyl-CoA hydratase/carnithine racemase